MTWSLEIRQRQVQTSVMPAPFHHWTLPGGGLWAAFYRFKDGYILRFPDLADFRITADGLTATCYPCPTLDDATRDHLFLNQVLPLMLSRQGKLVFHGSAVETNVGAIAFLGPSGRGKSTLAAAFATAGHRFLTDDCLVVVPGERHYHAQPSHPAVRLREDSRAALLPIEAKSEPAVSYTTKAKLAAGTALPHRAEPLPLAAAYLLGDGNAHEIAIGAIKGAQSVTEWVGHSFLLDIEDRRALACHLGEVAALSDTVPSFQLDYPRCYEGLDSLRCAIISHVQRSGLAL